MDYNKMFLQKVRPYDESSAAILHGVLRHVEPHKPRFLALSWFWHWDNGPQKYTPQIKYYCH